MEEKILKIREKLIKELGQLEDGLVVKLDYGLQFLDAVLFNYLPNREYKTFALPFEILKKIDFSNVSFDKFRVSFSNTTRSFKELIGVNINPQTIYKKDLRNVVLEGVNFIGPFTGALISGADFTGSTGAVIDPMELCMQKEVASWSSMRYTYNIDVSNCKFNGVTFTGAFRQLTRREDIYSIYEAICVDIEGADFTGSKGAVIKLGPASSGYYRMNPDRYYYNDLSDCILTDATIKGSYVNVILNNTDFTGAKGNLTINPQEINGKSLQSCKFNGVMFTGSFDDCNICKSDFTGSRNAHINVSKLDETFFKNTNFTDANVTGLKEKALVLSEDGFIEDGVIEIANKFLGIEHETEIIKKQQLEEARKRLVEHNKRKIRERIKELANLLQSQEKLGIPESKIYGSIPITQEVFLKEVSGHFEIDEEFVNISLLRFLNLSMIDFTNVKVRGLDFRYTGARINPQTVYDKDISYCTFDEGNIKFFDDFTGVMMEEANFEECDFGSPKIK